MTCFRLLKILNWKEILPGVSFNIGKILTFLNRTVRRQKFIVLPELERYPVSSILIIIASISTQWIQRKKNFFLLFLSSIQLVNYFVCIIIYYLTLITKHNTFIYVQLTSCILKKQSNYFICNYFQIN